MLAYLSKSVSKSELNKNGIYCYHHCRYDSYNPRTEGESEHFSSCWTGSHSYCITTSHPPKFLYVGHRKHKPLIQLRVLTIAEN